MGINDWWCQRVTQRWNGILRRKPACQKTSRQPRGRSRQRKTASSLRVRFRCARSLSLMNAGSTHRRIPSIHVQFWHRDRTSSNFSNGWCFAAIRIDDTVTTDTSSISLLKIFRTPQRVTSTRQHAIERLLLRSEERYLYWSDAVPVVHIRSLEEQETIEATSIPFSRPSQFCHRRRTGPFTKEL